MKKLKQLFLITLITLIGLFSVHTVLASTVYTTTDVAQHNTASSCWVIYNSNVYDITTYLSIHNQRYSNITGWCGTDITTDFDNVARHTSTATTLLATFQIGTLTTTNGNSSSTTTITDTVGTTTTTNPKVTNPYNLVLPLLLGLILYWGSRIIVLNKNIKKTNCMNVKNFNGFWNTILLISFLVPTFGFGIIMILQYQFPNLADGDFNFLYWHVELSVFMGALGISHFIQRFKIYLTEIKQK